MTWRERAIEYNEMLGGETDLSELSEKKAKDFCREELENIIAINGFGELFEVERELAKDLGIREE